MDGEASGKGVIRFGLAAVKGVGEKAVEAIIEARQEVGPVQEPLRLLRARGPARGQPQVIEALIKCGAFDGSAATATR